MITALIRRDLQDFVAYDAARQNLLPGKIWLNANESPQDSFQKNDGLNRYPGQQPQTLVQRLADLYQVNPDQLCISRGSDEAIDLLIRLFCEFNRNAIMICPPTYGMYAVSARLQGAGVITVPLQPNTFKLDVEKILENYQPKVKLIFICSPNNPTANLQSYTDILCLCRALQNKAIIVVDEAYWEFSQQESLLNCISDYNNLVVLRTLSKAYGLAGARCGVTLANPELIAWQKRISAPYPIPIPVIESVVKSLTDLTHYHNNLQMILIEKQKLQLALGQSQSVEQIYPSDTNFILFKTQSAVDFLKHFNDRGIMLRDFSNQPMLENCIRISVGSPQENDEFIKVLNDKVLV